MNLWLEVIDGQDSGERFWDGTYFSASKRGNAMAFAKLQAANSSMDDAFWAGDPDGTAIETALMGAKIKVQTTFEENKDGGNPWLRCTYVPTSDKVEF